MVFVCNYMNCGVLMEHTHLKMSWIQHEIRQNDGVLTYPPPPFSDTSNFHRATLSSSSSGSRISPAVLFIIVILAVLFFVSGLLHLLVRFLTKHPSSSSSSQANRLPELYSSDALQRQLQQLFHLHDSGLDQAFIDALPVFHYKDIVGLKEPFDCAVCLCEFSEKDKLRLLPTCSHAFHISCIDTWLLSNSTCPLCRGALFAPGFSMENPMYDFDDLREDECAGNGENRVASRLKSVEIEEIVVDKKGVFPVRLGKFKRLNGDAVETVGETSSSNLDARRCFSMGSYEYVLNESNLRVALRPEQESRDMNLTNPSADDDVEGKKISNVTKGESYSVSKIWQWSKKGKFSSSSDAQTYLPSSLNVELPWLKKTQGT